MEDDLEQKLKKWKTTSNKMEDNLNKKLEDDLKKNGRQPLKKMEDNIFKINGR